MIDNLKRILIAEKKALLKGWLISIAIIFPLTFFPVLIKHGLSAEALLARVPASFLYAIGFATLIAIASIANNYNNLVARKLKFGKPAFKALKFRQAAEGVGSIAHSLKTILYGEVGDYNYRIALLNPETSETTIEVIPLIETERNKRLAEELIANYGFEKNWYLARRIMLTEEDVEDPNAIREILEDLSAVLNSLDAEPLEVEKVSY